jgi:hypothetical protein
MYANGQTLMSRDRKRLVRIKPVSGAGIWDMMETFIDEEGKEFIDDIEDYIYIQDEFGRPYSHPVENGQYVDISAKKYLISDEELLQMRKTSLEEWEKVVLARMNDNAVKFTVYTVNGKYHTFTCDEPGKFVHCAFCDGSKCNIFKNYFLKNREAKPLFIKYNPIKQEFVDGPMIFCYKNKIWLYDNEDLVVIKDIKST